jgi:hypothetical protein
LIEVSPVSYMCQCRVWCQRVNVSVVSCVSVRVNAS